MLLYLYSIQGCASHAKVLHVILVDANVSVLEEFDVVVCLFCKEIEFICRSKQVYNLCVYKSCRSEQVYNLW